MKRLIVIIACLLVAGIAGKAQDVVADFLHEQKNAEVFTQVNISSEWFGLMADICDDETEGIIRNLTGMRVLKTSDHATEYFSKAKQMLEKKARGYVTLMNVKKEEENVWMYIRKTKGVIAELVILAGDSSKFVLMNFTGKIDLKKISRLTDTMDINEIGYLDEVKDSTGQKAL